MQVPVLSYVSEFQGKDMIQQLCSSLSLPLCHPVCDNVDTTQPKLNSGLITIDGTSIVHNPNFERDVCYYRNIQVHVQESTFP